MSPGLSRKILLPTVFIIAIGLLAVLVMEHWNARTIVREELSLRLNREVALSAKLIDSWLQARMIDMEAWSRQDVIIETLTEAGYYGRSAQQGAFELLKTLKAGYQQYESIYLADTKGKLRAIAPHATTSALDPHLSDRASFQKALEGKTVLSNVIISPFSHHKSFTVATPVRSGDTIVGVLGGVIDFTLFNTLFLDNFKVKQFGYAFLVDGDRQLLGSSRHIGYGITNQGTANMLQRMYATSSGHFIRQEKNGDMLTVFQHLERTNWIFVIDQALDETLKPIARIFRINSLGALLILCILSALIIALFRQLIVQRLQDMLRVTMTVRQGDFSQRIARSAHLPDEISELTESFNIMIDQLDKTLSTLNDEIRVRRTTEAALADHQENLEKIIAQRSLELQKEISERRKAEERLVRAEKLEMIGTLAGGVAHDLNNILSGIVSYPDLLLIKLSPDHPMYPALRTIKESGEKAAAIVQDLLTLARRGINVREPVNLNQLAEEYLSSPEFQLLKSHHPGLKIDTACAPDLLPIIGSPVHLAKTIMNLVANGAESMGEGGNIRISTENRYLDSTLKLYENISEGDYAVLQIQDQGCGIAVEDLQKIFEPFFTSKRMGSSGTGLGMAVVWGTVKDHNGYIDCESSPLGTTFSLYFPVTAQSRVPLLPLAPQPEQYQGYGEHILVVDDIAEQREIASSILTELGYTITTVASGEQALALARKEHFDLLLLDMILGEGIDGYETYRSIKEFVPDQPAIITSGFSETTRISEAIRLGVGQYIKKPYMIHTLGMAIRQELDK